MSYSLRGRINTVRKLSDFQELERLVRSECTKHITVVGGGFLGSELVLTLAQMARDEEEQQQQQQQQRNNTNGDSPGASDEQASSSGALQLCHVFVEDGPLRKHLPDYLSTMVEQAMNRLGIETLSQRVVTSLQPTEATARPGQHLTCRAPGDSDDDAGDNEEEVEEEEANVRPCVTMNLMGKDRESVVTNYVVLATTHVQPDIHAARQSALETDETNGGLVTNALLEVQSGFFAAGTAASYYDTKLGRRRVHSYDHAVNSGLCAGHNMVAAVRGASATHPMVRYRHQPSFRSLLPGTGLLLEGIGTVDAGLTTVGVWLASRDRNTGEAIRDEQFSRGIIYYLKGNIVVGAVAVNASECVGLLREVLNEQRVVGDYKSLRTRVQLAPEHWLKVIVTNPKSSSDY